MRVPDDNSEMLPLDVVVGVVVDPFSPLAAVELAPCEVGDDTVLTGIVACNEGDPIMLVLVEICMT
jgi:hypothetical protein